MIGIEEIEQLSCTCKMRDMDGGPFLGDCPFHENLESLDLWVPAGVIVLLSKVGCPMSKLATIGDLDDIEYYGLAAQVTTFEVYLNAARGLVFEDRRAKAQDIRWLTTACHAEGRARLPWPRV